MKVKINDPIPLSLQLTDEESGAFPQAVILDAGGAPLAASPVSLPHVSDGLYKSEAVTMPATDRVFVQYKVYSDAGFTERHPIHCDTLKEVFGRDFAAEDIETIKQSVINLENSSLPGQELVGFLEDDGSLVGLLEDAQGHLVGFLEDDGELVGAILEDELLVGFLESSDATLVGYLEC